MRFLAIDFGEKRIGLATGDDVMRLALPYDVLADSPPLARERIVRAIEEEGIDQLVVGLPLNMDDSIGPSARRVIEWGNELSRKTCLPVVFVDERLSSFAAEQMLQSRRRAGGKMTRQHQKRALDAVAAAHFLQAYLTGAAQPIIF